MNAPHEEWTLDTLRLGRRVLVFDRLDSTNNLAAILAEESDNAGLAILADEQTTGRGQHGRTWLSAAGQSVLLSLLVPVPPELCRPVVLTAWAAVGVCALVRQTVGRSTRIKWPNDVLLQGRKVCGILIESGNPKSDKATVRTSELGFRIFAVGIGLNVQQSTGTFAAAGLTEATSLAQWVGQPLDTHAVAVDLIHQLDRDFDTLCQGDLSLLETRWREGLGLLDKQVIAECSDGTHRGRLVELSFSRVRLSSPGVAAVVLAPERIQHLHEADH